MANTLDTSNKLNTGGVLDPGGSLIQNNTKKSEEKVSDPLSPANIGLPVIITDDKGNRIGNVWSPSKNGLKDAITNLELGKASGMYLDLKTGQFSNYPSSTMSYKDGKIKLNVSSDVSNSDWYKNLINSDVFKQVAALYAADPTGKTELEMTKTGENGEETKEKKTINDILREFAEQLEKSSKDYQSYIDTRTNVRTITGGALELTDSDIDIMANFKGFNKDKFSDSDVVLLPKFAQDFFKDYESYDAESGSVSAKDFYEKFYNLNEELPESAKEIIEVYGGGELGDDHTALQQFGESDKDYAIDLIRLRTSQEMTDIVERSVFYKKDLSDEEKAYYATEYVKCYSLYKTMTQDTPNTDSWTGFNLAVQGLNAGMNHSILVAGERLEHFYSQIAYGIVDGGVRTAAAFNTPFSWLGELLGNLFTGGWDKMTKETRNMYEHFDEWYAENSNEASVLGELRKSIDETGELLDSREDIASKVWESVEADLAQSYANTEAMVRIGSIAGTIITQVAATNMIGGAVGGVASYAFAEGASVALTGYHFATLTNMSKVLFAFASTAATASQAISYMRILQNINAIAPIVGFSANILMQGLVDTFIENPSRTDAMIFGESNETIGDFQNEIRFNAALNLIGESLPFAGKKIGKGGKTLAKAVGNTRPGIVTEAVMRKIVNRITLPGRKVYEGIAEFMTRKSKEFIIEEGGSDAPFSGKLNPEKRMQNMRKEIINIQEQIKEANVFRGDDSWTENAKKIDELIQKRIDLEEKLGTAKKLYIAETRRNIIKNAGLDIEIAEMSEYTAELTQISKKMKQTNLPGSFSKETGDYINDVFNRQLLLNKVGALESTGKLLSEKEAEALSILEERIGKYEASIPKDLLDTYKTSVNNYLDSNYRYYYKLKEFLSSDAGGNIVTKEELERMRGNVKYGSRGETYMPLYAVSGFKGAEDLEALLNDPSSIMREGKVKTQVESFNRKQFSADVTYLDPNYTRDLVTNAYAQVMNAAEMSDAIVKVGRATSIQTDSQGKILKTPKDVESAKKAFYKDIEDKFEDAFRQSAGIRNLGPETIKDTKVKAVDYYKTIKRGAQRTIKETLGLDQKGLKTYASTLNTAEISQISKVYSLPAYSRKIRTVADLNAMYDSLSNAQKRIVKKVLNDNDLTVSRWNYAVTNNNLDTLLYRQYIKDSKSILSTKFYKNLVAEARAAELEAEEAFALRNAKMDLETAEAGIKTGNLKGTEAEKLNAKKTKDYNKIIRNSIVDAVEGTADSLLDNTYLEQLVKEYEKNGISSDVTKEYLIYQWLYDNSGKNEVLEDIAFRFYNAPSKVSDLKISTDAAKGYSKKFQKAAESIVESKLNKTIAKIQEEGVEGLVDMESTVKRVEEYFKEITDLYGSRQIVEAWDRETGKFKYYQVDHSTYTLVTNYPTFKRNNLFARTMARINAIARFGQITIRMASLVTQGFKDTFNAMILGGWDQILLDNPDTYKKISEYIGSDVVEAFKKEMTSNAWKDFLASAEWQGLSIEEAIAKAEVNNELLTLKIEGGPGTSTSYFSYRSLYEPTDEVATRAAAQIEAAKDTWTAETKAKWQTAYEKARVAWYKASQITGGTINKVEDTANILHNARETFLRKQVYRQNFMDALSNGKSLEQARNYAQYFMENATTNFSRGFAWGSNIIRSIPYFGAMLNGASSMVRLMEVDPLGIMTRFVTDLAIPVVGLTVLSMEDPVDAEIYKNIPEYEKEGNLHWVVGGQVVTIPLPEELAKFILPIRHAAEKICGANDLAFHELMLNDLLNMPTISLNGVMALDKEKLYGDVSVTDRLSSLAMDLFNTMAPNSARTAWIAVTGKDPYTNRDYGRQKWYVDENGEYQLMSVSEYGFANDLSSLFKSWGWNVSATMAEGLLSSLFGTGSIDLIEGIRDLSVSIQEGKPDITALISPSLERAGNVLTGTARTDAEEAQIAWYNLYYDIKNKKNELLAPDGKLAHYSQDIDKAKDQATLGKKTEFYNAEVRNWQNSVMEKVKQYTSKYGDYFDRSKFAASLQMMTAELSIDNVRNSDNYFNARALAVETMLDAGFDSPSDSSIFGYVYRDPYTGKVSIKYTDPLVISLSENLLWYQGDEAIQMLKDTIELSGLKDKYNKEIYPVYSKYMNDKNYTAANKLAAEWDVELVKTIKPIIDQYNVGQLLNKSDAIDLLDNYIIVPSTTEAMGKGKYYSSKTGLNKRRGYAQSYIKKIYGAMKENK